MKKSILLLTFGLLLIIACSKEETSKSTSTKNQGTQVSLEDTLSRNWKVVNATHNGTTDNSSKGLELEIRKDGSYTLVNTGYIGTWEFQKDKTKVLLDEGNSQFETVWTIQSMSSSDLKVSFKSPFTGGSAVWEMQSQ